MPRLRLVCLGIAFRSLLSICIFQNIWLPSISVYPACFFRDGRPFAKMLIRYPDDVLRTWNACASRFALWSEKIGINNGRWREQIAIVAIQHDFAVPLFCFRLICFQVPHCKGFALTSWHHVFMNRLWKMRYSQVPPSPSSPPYANRDQNLGEEDFCEICGDG